VARILAVNLAECYDCRERMPQDSSQTKSEMLKELYAKAGARLAVLRRKRLGILEGYMRKGDDIRIEKVKKQLNAII
jgi:hypothetical protein